MVRVATAVVLLLALGGGAVLVARDRAADPAAAPAVGSGASPAAAPSSSEASSAAAARLPAADDLLTGVDLAPLGGGRPWTVRRTDANTTGDGINSVCQQRRFADPRGYAALVRTFRGPGPARRTAVQTVEVSRTVRQARATYDRTVGWYAGCQEARLRLLTAYDVRGLGDRADVLTLRIYDRPATTVSVAVARTGSVVTSTVARTSGRAPEVARVVGALAQSVTLLCGGTPDRLGGACTARPRARAVPPPPAGSGEETGILAAADLPPVGRIDRPWTGTRPATPRGNPAATTCDRASFVGARRRSRTFVIARAGLPREFGLTETYGTFGSRRAAVRFLAGVRERVAGCERRDLATEVTGVDSGRRPVTGTGRDSSQWRLRTEVTESRTVRFRVGLVRTGSRVAQVTFTSAPGADMSDDGFDAVLARAGQRLRELGDTSR